MNLQKMMQELEQRLASKKAEWVPQTPTPKQKQFLDLTCEEALYGGAAGGGKSSALLMGALAHVDTPGYAAVLFRKTFTDLNLPEGLMDRANQWLTPTAAVWDGYHKTWRFPSGASLSFGYLDNPNDHFRYQGSAFQYIGFDEATQILPQSYLYLRSRLRRLRSLDVPLLIRGATNPGGRYHHFYKERFVDPATAEDRVFVPATLKDNPHIDQESYRKTLEQLDAVTRAQLLDGLWIVSNNELVFPLDPITNLIDELPHELSSMQCVLAVDLGTRVDKPTTAFCVVGWHPYDGTAYVLRSFKRPAMNPQTIGEEVLRLDEEFGGFQVVNMDAGGLGGGYISYIQTAHGMQVQPAEKRDRLGHTKLLRGSLERGDTKVLRSGCKQLIDELSELHWDDNGTADAKGSENHCADAFRYAWRAAQHYLTESPSLTPGQGDPAYEDWLEEQAIAELRKEQNKPFWEE